MGVAVVGMHYTGIAAVRVNVDSTAPAPSGLNVFTFLFPVFVLGLLVLAVPAAAVMMVDTEPELTTSGRPDEVLART